MMFLGAFSAVHMGTLILKTKGFKLTNTVNMSISLSTGIFWGYFFDIFLFGKNVDIISLLGAFFVVVGSLINMKTKKK